MVITFFKSIASGKDKPTTAIMNARAVPIGIPFVTNPCITGSIPDAFVYMGIARIVAIGTAKKLSFPK